MFARICPRCSRLTIRKVSAAEFITCRVLSGRATTEFNACINSDCVRNYLLYYWPSATKTKRLVLQYLILILHALLAVSLTARPDLATMTDILSENQAYFK